VSRRTSLVGLAGVAGVTAWAAGGCTSSDRPAPGAAGPSPSATPAASRPPAVEPDVRLAATVLGVEQAMLDRVLAVGRRHPRLHARLHDARTAHQQHVRLLASAVPAGFRPTRTRRQPYPVPGSVTAALTALARAEDRLARTDRRSAQAAESGAFARVLGSMAAAASQLAVTSGPAETREESR
jgi:hypothetical protein